MLKGTCEATDGRMWEEITWSSDEDFPGGFFCDGRPASAYIEGFIPIRVAEVACIIREPETCQRGREEGAWNPSEL